MRAGRVAAALLAALALAPRPARADLADFLNKPIVSVRLVVEGRETDEPALTSVVQTVVGRPLAMADVRETVGHLFSLRRFEDVRVDAEPSGAGVALRYDLSPVHPVTRIEFTGALDRPGVDAGRLRQAVVERYGPSPSLGRVADLTRAVADELAARGYLHAAVDTRTEIRHDPDRATLVFAVQPGARTTIGTIVTQGEAGITRDALLDELDVAPGDPYQRQALDAGVERYLEGRHRLGYYLASLTPGVQLEDGDRIARLTLTVDTGPHVQVRFSGDTLPSDVVKNLVPIEEEGSADQDLLEDSSLRIESYLRARGYRDAAAPFRSEEADGELVITFDVRRGPLYRVGTFAVTGNPSVPFETLAPALRTRAGEPFSEAALDADVVSIETLYRRRGFSAARASGDTEPAGRGADEASIDLVVTITVAEGVRTLIGDVTFTGNDSVDTDALRAVVGVAPGAPFVAAQLAADRESIAVHYADLGYPTAAVTVAPQFGDDGGRADITFTIHEGVRVFVDHVLVVGNTRTSVDTIERELQLGPGDPVGRAALVDSQRRLASLGLFRRVVIDQVSHGDEARRDLIVTVEEAPATTIGYGAGVEGRSRTIKQLDGTASDRFEVAPRASFEMTRRNLFGKNRSLSFFTSASLPKNFADQAQPTDSTRFGFVEYRVVGTFREPRVRGTDADLSVTGTLEQQIRSSFNYARRGAGATLTRRVSPNVLLSGSYQLERTNVFDEQLDPEYQNLLDRTFSLYRLSSFAITTIHDTRSDSLDPHDGGLLSANAQLAALSIGSQASFVKLFLTGQAFRALPRSHGAVLAASARVGLGFPGQVIKTLDDGSHSKESADLLPESERFFAGGDTTVRGFALDRLGTPETIVNGFPIGGDGLIILNGELRVPVWRALGAVGFLDTGNVFPHASDIDLRKLRSAIGFGIRFGSPFGPIRADLGFKMDRQPGEHLAEFHLSFGQAF